MSKRVADELHALIKLAAKKAAKKVGASPVCDITYTISENLTGSLHLITAKSEYNYPKYAINFLKLCDKYPNVNSEILDTILTAGDGEKYYFYGSKKSKGRDYALVLPVNDDKKLTLIPFKTLGINLPL
ncbi:hypothetical protein [Photobacterium leiognathi]|uniref:hypothetical protein n=1 Tax=Photobacterium leiognathi TaxID=553611 RepID=UPI002980A5EE|nr:hypothetical protein [Photobacterium leiognathi]